MKNLVDYFFSRLEIVEERISELKYKLNNIFKMLYKEIRQKI